MGNSPLLRPIEILIFIIKNSNMKKISLWMFAAILIICGACTNASEKKVKYAVSGTTPADEMVYLIDRLTNEPIDSIKASNGKFEFSGEQDKDALLSVQREGSEWQVLFFNDGTPVEINLDDNTLKGSDLNQRLTDCDLATSEAISAISKLSEELNALPEEEQEARQKEFEDRAMKAYDNIGEAFKKVLNDNRDNLIPAAFIGNIAQFLNEEEMEEALDEKYPYMQHPISKKLKEQLDAYKAQQKEAEEAKQKIIGQKFTDFEQQDVDGKTHKLSEYAGKGKWVMVDFWASWCGPCRGEMPNVVEAYKKYHAKGFDIVGVSYDQNKEAWVKAIGDLNMAWVQLSDLKGWENATSAIYGINSIPASLLINPEGVIVERDLRGEGLQKKLAEIFGE